MRARRVSSGDIFAPAAFVVLALVTALFLPGCASQPEVIEEPHREADQEPAPEVDRWVRIVHPPEGALLPAIDRTFVFGYADPGGRLFINGRQRDIHHPEGGFLAMVSLAPGSYTIRAVLWVEGRRFTATRTVRVTEPVAPSPASPLTIEYVRPRLSRLVRPGDEVEIVAKGSPGMEATFTVEGVRGRFPMVETFSPVAGVYRGSYLVREEHRLEESRVRVRLEDPDRWWRRRHRRVSAGTLSRLRDSPPKVAEVTSPHAVVRAHSGVASAAGYKLFPPPGVRFEVVGAHGNDLKVRLSERRVGWIWQAETRTLPAGTPAPRTTAGSLAVVEDGDGTQVRVSLEQTVPYAVSPSADGRFVDVSFFGTVSLTNWISYDTAAGSVSLLEWFQDDADTYRIRIHVPPGSFWGYDARYEGTTFVLQLRSPPPIASADESPLSGLRVAVDAGHGSPDPGARGPTGLLEKDVALAISFCLRDRLIAEGAEPVMIRETDHIVPLYERPRRAWEARADMLVSVHANALGYAGNPLERHGYGMYYFHPHSFPLARALQQAFGEVVGRGPERPDGLRDDGVRYGNLALARTPQMPAVLVESAYIIHPREEALLRTEEFQCAVAEAITLGLRRYAEDMRPVR